MDSFLSTLPQLGNLSVVTGCVIGVLAVIALFSLFMMGRRAIRYHRAQRFDDLSFKMHKQWREIVRGDIPPEEWRGDALKCEIVQSIVIQEIGAAVDKDRAGLQEFLRASGLIEDCIHRVHEQRGWARRRAMLALGATRTLGAIAPLSEGLEDWQLGTRRAAMQNL